MTKIARILANPVCQLNNGSKINVNALKSEICARNAWRVQMEAFGRGISANVWMQAHLFAQLKNGARHGKNGTLYIAPANHASSKASQFQNIATCRVEKTKHVYFAQVVMTVLILTLINASAFR